MMGLISFADRSRDAQMDLVYERVFKLESLETLAGKSFSASKPVQAGPRSTPRATGFTDMIFGKVTLCTSLT